MALDPVVLFDALTSLATATGQFNRVNGHEPKAAPGRTGVSCAIWVSDVRPIQSSGVSSVSMRIEFTCRIFLSMLMEPQDAIDPRILMAMDALFTAIIGNFNLDLPDGRYVDVLGSDGDGLRCLPGYLEQDGTKFRVMEIFVPILLNDVYTEVA